MRVWIISFLMVSCGAAQALDLSALERPGVKWNNATARTADVTCDGQPDIVAFGAGRKSVWVGVVPGGRGKPQTMEFALARARQDGFCAHPKRIGVQPLACNTGDGPLENCKPAKSCKAFSIDDGDCDAFNFYWDGRRKIIRWWRY